MDVEIRYSLFVVFCAWITIAATVFIHPVLPPEPTPQEDLTPLFFPRTQEHICLPFENRLHLNGCPMVLV